MSSTVVTGPAAAAPDTDVASHPTWARSVATAVVPICYLLAAWLLTRNLWADPASRLVTGNPHDADQFAWFMRYAAAAVSHDRLPALVTKALNAPTGVNLMWNTALLLPGIVLAPVTLLAGPQVSLTVLTTAGFAGSAAAMFWVLRRWDVTTSAAALAGAVYGFSPALLQSALGHYDLELSILPPLIVSAGLRLAVGPRVRASRSAGAPVRWPARWLARVPAWARTGVWLGLLVAGQVFIDEEILLTTALAGVLMVLVLALSRPYTALRRVMPAAAGLVLAAAVALALDGRALWTQFRGPLVEHGSPYSPIFYVNDLTSFVTPQSALFFHTAASAAEAASYQGKPPEYLGYLGWPLIAILVVALVASWRRPAGRVVGVTAVALFVFSLGSHPLIAGTSHPGVDLPWFYMQRLSIFSEVLPDRLSILADGAAAALLAVGIDEVRARLATRRPFWRRPALLAAQRPALGWPAFLAEHRPHRPAWGWPAFLAARQPALGWRARLAAHRPFWRRPALSEAQRQFWRRPTLPEAQRPALGWRVRLGQMAVLAVAVACCLPLLPRPLPESSVMPLPAGWSAIFAGLNIGPDTRVVVLPFPRRGRITLPMRWYAESGEPSEMMGGYFIGPGVGGKAQLGGLTPQRLPRYLNYLWGESLPPGSPYGSAAPTDITDWTDSTGPPPLLEPFPPGAPILLQRPPLRAKAALTVLASWRPQAVVADATATSPLGLFLTNVLGPPTISVDGLIGWQLSAFAWPPSSSQLLGNPQPCQPQLALQAGSGTRPCTTVKASDRVHHNRSSHRARKSSNRERAGRRTRRPAKKH
jgi:hypothetical protein